MNQLYHLWSQTFHILSSTLQGEFEWNLSSEVFLYMLSLSLTMIDLQLTLISSLLYILYKNNDLSPDMKLMHVQDT